MTLRGLILTVALLAIVAAGASGCEPVPPSTKEERPSAGKPARGAGSDELMEAVRQDLDVDLQNHESFPGSLPSVKVESANVSSADSTQKPAREMLAENSLLSLQNPQVQAWKEYFSGRGGDHLQAALLRLGPHREHLEGLLQARGLPPEMLAVAFVESNFVRNAVSPKGATGLWQFMPATAVRYGLELKPSSDDRTDFEKSTTAAARYLVDLHQRFSDWLLALAAYNAGENQVESAIARGRSRDFWILSQLGLLPQETSDYVPKVLGALLALKQIVPSRLEGDTSSTGTSTVSGHQHWAYALASGPEPGNEATPLRRASED